MSWLIFPGNPAKILFLDSHAKNLQVRTYLDVFLVSTMARSWQDLPRFNIFLIKMYQVSVHWVLPVVENSRLSRFRPFGCVLIGARLSRLAAT